MQKTGRPWYRRQNDSWYVQVDGKQVQLAKGKENKAAAYFRFAELLEAGVPSAPRPAATVGELVEAYKAHLKNRIKPTTFASYLSVLNPWLRAFSEQPAESVQAAAMEEWAKKQRWSATTQRFALTVTAGAFRWAKRTSLLCDNPLRDLQKPRARSRGADVLIDDALHRKLQEVASPQFRDFIEAVHATGARPGEIARVEARHIVWDANCITLTEHKTAKSGRARIIYLPPHVLPLFGRLAAEHPTGPIFLNTRKEPWKKTGWKQAMERAQRKLNLPQRPLTSGYRHTFATDALESGVPDAHVAELLGHASTAMIHRHYGHLAAKAKTLRASLERVRSLNRSSIGRESGE